MSKPLSPPISRLICLGGAKACTNVAVGSIPEDNPELGFDA